MDDLTHEDPESDALVVAELASDTLAILDEAEGDWRRVARVTVARARSSRARRHARVMRSHRQNLEHAVAAAADLDTIRAAVRSSLDVVLEAAGDPAFGRHLPN